MKKLLTLCFVHAPPRILLGMKKRGFGAGRWNGFGGKVADGESIEAAARREFREETGIEAGELQRCGTLTFHFLGDPEVLEVSVFRVADISGIPVETEEMCPQWFLESEIPYDEMWPDDRYWFPLFLAGKDFRGEFFFEGTERLLRYHVEELSQTTPA